MGVDLTLLPVEGDCRERGWGYAHTMLSMDRNSKLWEAIDGIPVETRPDYDFSSYIATNEDGDDAYGVIKETPYGEPLTYAKCGDLVAAWQPLVDDMSTRNRAVLEYLKVLKPETSVALYWN